MRSRKHQLGRLALDDCAGSGQPFARAFVQAGGDRVVAQLD